MVVPDWRDVVVESPISLSYKNKYLFFTSPMASKYLGE